MRQFLLSPLMRVPMVFAVPVAVILVLSSGAAAASPSAPTLPGTLRSIVSTVPKNGDVNPYGMALVQQSTGRLVARDVLVSNFNNAKNLQGTGATIVEVSPAGSKTLFDSFTSSKPGALTSG